MPIGHKGWSSIPKCERCEKLQAENKELKDITAKKFNEAAETLLEQLQTKIKHQKKELLAFRLQKQRTVVCGKCGKEYQTLKLFDCPHCEKALNQKGG